MAQFPIGVDTLTAKVDFIDVKCYDNEGRVVSKWPADSPDRRETIKGQPNSLKNGAVPSDAGANYGNSTQAASSAKRLTFDLICIMIAFCTLL